MEDSGPIAIGPEEAEYLLRWVTEEVSVRFTFCDAD